MRSTDDISALFEPIKLGPLQIKNRVVMTSMHTGLEDKPWSINALADFYRARAAGGAGMIITGGYAPHWRGTLYPGASTARYPWSLIGHSKVCAAVQEHDCKIILQLLHAGRYGYHPFNVAPSAIKARINRFSPKAMTAAQIQSAIKGFAISAKRAQKAGYNGVEIMGSEGYLINQFLAERSNQRNDQYGGNSANRQRFAHEVVAAVRQATGADFAIIYRLSIIDLVEQGQSFEEVLQLANALEIAGVDAFTSGIGWHEARIPTIVTSVPRLAFADVAAKVQAAIGVPLIASNRINTPEDAASVLNREQAQMVGMARPFLADAQWVEKAQAGQSAAINPCIACNQVCLDNVFAGKSVSCLVNPKAGSERDWPTGLSDNPKNVLVVGAGPAGMAAAVEAAQRGHRVRLVEQKPRLGGQIWLAAQVPSKAEFKEILRYFEHQLAALEVKQFLGRDVQAEDISWADHGIIATGVVANSARFDDVDIPIYRYDQVLSAEVDPGKQVALIGGGGIAVDVAQYLAGDHEDIEQWRKRWGVDPLADSGLVDAQAIEAKRQVHILIRSDKILGSNLGKTSAWVHRSELKQLGVKVYNNASLVSAKPGELIYVEDQKQHSIAVDSIVLCTGQRAAATPAVQMDAANLAYTIVGGAADASRLDAARAISQGVRAAADIG